MHVRNVSPVFLNNESFDFIVMNMEATDVFQSKTIYAIYKMNAELIF